jgi:uncharacterized protein (TIGR02099 family)
MERVKRRWWTWAVSLLAAAVIFGAVVSGLFQLAVLALPSYRDDLSVWVTKVADRPVRIGGVSLVWRGVYPRLDLSDITLYTQAGDEALSAERLSLGFSLLRLLRGDALPNRIELAGLSLAVDVDEDGRLRIRGFEMRETTPRDEWSALVRRFRYVRLENCEVRFTDPRLGAREWPFKLRRLDLGQSARGFEFDGVLQLQPSQGGEVVFEAELDGTLAELGSWSGEFNVEAEGLRPQGWLAHWLRPGAQIAAEDLSLALEGRLTDGRLETARIDVEAGPVLVAQPGRHQLWQSLEARATVQSTDARGWQLQLSRLEADDRDLARGAVRLQTLPDGGRALDVEMDRMELAPLAPWLGVWRTDASWPAWASRVGGRVENLVLRLRPRADDEGLDYSLSARLHDLQLHEDTRLGFAGLNGELSADQNGGRLRVEDGPLRLQLPSTLNVPVDFEHFAAQLQWQRGVEGWRLRVPSLDWTHKSLKGRSELTLDLPGEGSPVIDLSAELSAGDLRDAKPYMPRRWSDKLKQWLDRGIVAGRVPRAQLAIQGPLADFPYGQRPTGRWSLDIETADTVLSYAPDWPEIRDIAASLHFTGNSLSIVAHRGTVLGMPIESARARFADFHDAHLQVDATVGGELARQYDFLRASPLRKPLAGLVDHTRAAGKSKVALTLDIPLRDLHATQVTGTVAVDNAQLFYSGLESPVSGITGTVAFTEHDVSAEALSARFEDLPLTARIEPRAQTHGVVVIEFPFAPRPDAVGASQFIPAFLRARLSGESRWRGELPISRDTALELSSDLQGTAVDLPSPLGKAPESVVPLRLRIGSDAQAPVRVSMEYAQRLGLNLMLASSEGAMRPSGLHLRLGGARAPLATAGRFLIDGRLAVLDVAAFAGLLGSGDAASALPLDQADLDVDRLRWRAAETGPVHLHYAPRPGGWHVQLDGEAARGTIDWTRSGNHLVAQLQRLDLRTMQSDSGTGIAAAAAPPNPAPPAPPADPAPWPRLEVEAADLHLGDVALGRLSLRTQPIGGGQRLERLTLEGGEAQLQASGQWRRAEGRSTAALRFDLDSRDIGGLLKAFHYAPNLEAKRSRFSGELDWAPSAQGLQWSQPRGRIDVEVEDGQLRAVQPGGARVLGLINFYALPRRLTLNFKDVVGEGLSFDTIKGRFALDSGVATTSDLDIDAPSLRMEVRGKVGLAARDYDQRVKVYPDVSSGVTLGAALLGGPAVGALVLLAQELLEKPLDQATQLSYRVTGSWDNPKVERAEGDSPPRPDPRTP